MAKNIQDLRREAGYRSARDFASALGIPASTYARYESQPDGIPLKQAWAIADFLGCSIDMVVGREPVTAADMRGDVQKFYDALSDEGRSLMDDHMDYLTHREERARERRSREGHRRSLVLLTRYLRLFDEQCNEDAPFGASADLEWSSAERRDAFERYLSVTAAAKRDEDIRMHIQGLEVELRDGYIDESGASRHFTEEKVSEVLRETREGLEDEYMAKDREVIDAIMGAYDERVSEGRHDWLSFVG